MMQAAADHGVGDVLAFLKRPTPAAWFEQAQDRLSELLVDHAHCEKKAAGTALSLLYRYVDRPDLLRTLSRLAREELKHFEQVHALLRRRGVDYVHLQPGRYAAGLFELVGSAEPDRLVGTLLVGAVVEARSCERFLGLTRVLPADLARFYARLLAAEARHYRQYLALAGQYAQGPIEPMLERLLERDAALISSPDELFRFHSGPLAAA